ncbi:MAG: 50S ribosomal protein L18 [Patescibacteria group bacterium]|nr:50S ribosomal protein L18 [Patescibacteria group bacterium]
MNKQKTLNQIRQRRKARTRARIFGTVEKPRLSIFKSNRYIYIQMIDDSIGKTIVSVSAESSKNAAASLGEAIAKKAVEKGIKKAVLDRGNYKYHGAVKTIAETARKAGLIL